MSIERVTFPSKEGHELDGVLQLPEDGDARAYCLFAHCFTCGKSLAAVRHIGAELARENIGLLRFDFTGLGQSEGEFAETTFATNLSDLHAASEFLASEYEPPRILAGHSLGGAAALAAAGEIDSIRGVATIGAPSEPTHVRGLLEHADFDDSGTAEVSVGGRPFRIGRQFVEDLERHDLHDDINALRRPLIIFHAPRDTIVGIDHAEKIFKAAKHPKSFVSLGDSDHLVSDKPTARFLGHMLSAWSGFAIDDE